MQDKLKLLESCPGDRLMSLLHGVMDGVCGRSPPRYQDYSKVWGLEQWWDVTGVIGEFCKEAVKKNYSKDQMLKELDGVNTDYQEQIIDAISVRQDDLKRALIDATCAISTAQLADFDWQLKLVMSSDRLSSVQKPVVAVDFDVKNNEGSSTVSMEMNKEELSSLITSLEAANRAVNQLKS